MEAAHSGAHMEDASLGAQQRDFDVDHVV